MSNVSFEGAGAQSAPVETYSHGYGAASERMLERPVAPNIAFFLPHLRPGMSLLDCGCGPGTKFAHTVLLHLNEPLLALEEMYRVLKPGGVVGTRDTDHGSAIFEPYDPMFEQARRLFYRFWQHSGGDPFFGRHQRRLFREAGLRRVSATASTECFGDGDGAQQWGDTVARVFLKPVFADTVMKFGWADRQTLEEMVAALRAWGQHPDAFWAVVYCEAVGWKE